MLPGISYVSGGHHADARYLNDLSSRSSCDGMVRHTKCQAPLRSCVASERSHLAQPNGAAGTTAMLVRDAD
jgi:hypothetical protein